MTSIVGIDPGQHGAIAILDRQLHILRAVWPVPMIKERIGRTMRPRPDFVGLSGLVNILRDVHDVELVVIEEVGGRPAQSASAAFVFGTGYGALVQAFLDKGVPVKFARPSIWKPDMKAPKKKVEALARADQLFPLQRMMFRNERGTDWPDAGEAAMLALWWVEKGYRK